MPTTKTPMPTPGPKVPKIPTTKTQEQLALCCRKLRLSGNVVESAARHGGRAYQEYLLKVLNDELDYRDEARIGRYLNMAGFPRRYEAEQFRSDEVIFPSDTTLEDLLNLSFYDNGRNVVMYGCTGTGKTMLSIILGTLACRRGIPVKFYRTAGLINLLVESRERHTLNALKKKLDSVRILILDEFGYVPYDRTGSQLLFDYVSEIHEKENVSIIINTNLEFAQWSRILSDESMTTAFIGRLTHHCDMILFPGGNNRLKESSLFDAYNQIAAMQAAQNGPQNS